jgi:hypothetical protein
MDVVANVTAARVCSCVCRCAASALRVCRLCVIPCLRRNYTFTAYATGSTTSWPRRRSQIAYGYVLIDVSLSALCRSARLSRASPAFARCRSSRPPPSLAWQSESGGG